MNICRMCKSETLTPLISFGDHPIAQAFLNSPTDSEYVHPVNTASCSSCGLVQIVNPVPPEMLYTNVNIGSWKSNPHLQDVIEILKEYSSLTPDKLIVEVGSSDGFFLAELQQKGFKNVIGIEPGRNAQELALKRGVNTIATYLDPTTAETFVKEHGQADVLVSRHVFEHIIDLPAFGEGIEKLLKPGASVFIEVPHFDFFLDALDYSSVWEAHANYFTQDTLGRYLNSIGIEHIKTSTFCFSGEAQLFIGKYTGKKLPIKSSTNNDAAKVERFKLNWPKFKDELHAELKSYKDQGKHIAAYGAGCRNCCFINFTGIGPYLDFIVEDQQERQNKYMPGSRLKIMSGDTLDNGEIDLCLLGVNAENEEKVISKRKQFVDHGGEFLSMHPPSKRLLKSMNIINK